MCRLHNLGRPSRSLGCAYATVCYPVAMLYNYLYSADRRKNAFKIISIYLQWNDNEKIIDHYLKILENPSITKLSIMSTEKNHTRCLVYLRTKWPHQSPCTVTVAMLRSDIIQTRVFCEVDYFLFIASDNELYSKTPYSDRVVFW